MTTQQSDLCISSFLSPLGLVLGPGQPFRICQMHFNPFPYLGSPSSSQLEPFSTELVRKAAASFTSRHTCQKYISCIFLTWATLILQVPACQGRHLC